jgi:DNA-binding MarR family transcriptional regulator
MTDPDDLAADLRRVLGRLVRAGRGSDELSPRLAVPLGYLDREGPLTIGELAGRARVRQQSMTATVVELTRRGWAERRADPDDRRRSVVAITTSGRAALDADRERRVGWLSAQITEALDEDERRALAAALPVLARLGAGATG